MKKILSCIMLLSLLFTLCSCDRYVSSYSALGLVRKQTSHSCEASFHSLEGRLVFKIKKSSSGAAEGDIGYSIQVDEGEIILYYDIYGVMEELAKVNAGESVDERGGYVESEKPVYIIIEASKRAKGKISVDLDG